MTVKKKIGTLLTACILMIGAAGCSGNTTEQSETEVEIIETTSAIDTSDLFTYRDLKQSADLDGATYYTVEDGMTLTISEEGVYVFSGEASEVSIIVDTDSESKVQIVLNGVYITNTDTPVIYVKNADKVFVTTAEDSQLTVTNEFAEDEDNNVDAVIYSADDLVLNGTATLTINSAEKGVRSKDDLKITGGIYTVNAGTVAFYANDSIRIADGVFDITAGTDGFHAENTDDDSLGYIYIASGTYTMNVGDDAIHGVSIVQIDGGTFNISASEGIESTYVQINGGTLTIDAAGDGINAGAKSDAYEVLLQITGGTLNITTADGDTDGLDSNGDMQITGGTINITTSTSAIDVTGTITFTDGEVFVNGEQISDLGAVNTSE